MRTSCVRQSDYEEQNLDKSILVAAAAAAAAALLERITTCTQQHRGDDIKK